MALWVYIAMAGFVALVVSLPALFIGWLTAFVVALLFDSSADRGRLSDEEVERYWRNRELKRHEAETKTPFWHFGPIAGGLYVVVVFVALALLVRLIP